MNLVYSAKAITDTEQLYTAFYGQTTVTNSSNSTYWVLFAPCSEETINASKGYINYLRSHQDVEQKPGSWTLQYVNTIILTSFHYLQEIEELVEGIYAGFENPPRTCNINIVKLSLNPNFL